MTIEQDEPKLVLIQNNITNHEMKQYVVQGLEYVTALPSNEAVIRLPT
jgi:hypothetical protein